MHQHANFYSGPTVLKRYLAHVEWKRGNPGLSPCRQLDDHHLLKTATVGIYVLDIAQSRKLSWRTAESRVWEPWHIGPVRHVLQLIAPDFGTWLLRTRMFFGLRDNDDEWEEANAE